MYVIYGNIYHPYTPNVSIYAIHGSYGLWFQAFWKKSNTKPGNDRTPEQNLWPRNSYIPIYLQSGITYVGSDKSNWAANWTQLKLERVSSKLGDFRRGKREETSEAWSMVRTCQNQMDNDLKMENWSTNFWSLSEARFFKPHSLGICPLYREKIELEVESSSSKSLPPPKTSTARRPH